IGHVLRGDDRAALDPAPRQVVDETHLDRIAPDLERVHAHDRSGEPFPHVRVHPLNHGDDGDQKRHGYDDPEQRKERPQLVAPHGLQGLQDGFGQLHGGEANGKKPGKGKREGAVTTLPPSLFPGRLPVIRIAALLLDPAARPDWRGRDRIPRRSGPRRRVRRRSTTGARWRESGWHDRSRTRRRLPPACPPRRPPASASTPRRGTATGWRAAWRRAPCEPRSPWC